MCYTAAAGNDILVDRSDECLSSCCAGGNSMFVTFSILLSCLLPTAQPLLSSDFKRHGRVLITEGTMEIWTDQGETTDHLNPTNPSHLLNVTSWFRVLKGLCLSGLYHSFLQRASRLTRTCLSTELSVFLQFSTDSACQSVSQPQRFNQ